MYVFMGVLVRVRCMYVCMARVDGLIKLSSIAVPIKAINHLNLLAAGGIKSDTKRSFSLITFFILKIKVPEPLIRPVSRSCCRHFP